MSNNDNLEIIYILIARGSKLILCDYTDYSGNFQQISLLLLSKVKKDTKCEIIYDEYKFFSDDEKDITFLCMGKNLDTEIAFNFIADLKKKFFLTYDYNTQIKNAFSYELKEFSEEIKKLTNSYKKNPVSKIKMLENSMNKTKDILLQNVQQLLERDAKLNLIAQKSERLMGDSDNFMKNIQEIKRRQKMKKYKYYIILAGIVILGGMLLYARFS